MWVASGLRHGGSRASALADVLPSPTAATEKLECRAPVKTEPLNNPTGPFCLGGPVWVTASEQPTID
eukprot:scaffold1116_cov103-Isochrysis_galbana.AAC.3